MADFFVNPYTFVELRSGKSRCRVSPDDKKLTGKISCSLITKTQLSVPDISKDQDAHGIDRFPFFRVGGKAVIPGSGIRGVIRNVYEELTNSCMHINDKDDDFFSSRQNKEKPALLTFENGEYILYEADRIRITLGLNPADSERAKRDKRFHLYKVKEQEKQLSRFMIGGRIYYDESRVKHDNRTNDGGSIKTEFVSSSNSDGFACGYYMKADLMITGSERKENITHNNPGIFVKGERLAELDRRTINLLELNVREYAPKSKEVSSQYSECFKSMKRGETLLPVWYYKRGDRYYLAPSQMSRSFFFNKPRDMLEKMGYTACTVKKDQCEACALFGMVGLGKEGEAAASHLRFGDAVCESTDCFDDFYVLPVLGNPRLSSFEYYLRDKDNSYDISHKSFYYPIDPDQDNSVISGRKFYWHHKDKQITADDPKSVEIAEKAQREGKDNFSSKGSCFELVKSGQTFVFTIYFDGITKEQLQKLLFALNFGENSVDSELCHKIGHGKPVGLGSAKIVVDEVRLREFDGVKYSVSEDVKTDYFVEAAELFNKQDTEQILRVVNMNTIADSSLIMYPIVPFDPRNRRDGDDAAFKWFAANRDSLTTNPGTIAYKRRLPHIMADDQKLPQDIRNANGQQSIEQLQGKTETTNDDDFGHGSIMIKRRGERGAPPPKSNKKKKKKK